MPVRDELIEEVAKAIAVAEHVWWDSDTEPAMSLADTLARVAIDKLKELGWHELSPLQRRMQSGGPA